MPYLILYYEESLGMADYVLIMAPAIILASAFTFVWGRIYDKKGFYFSVAVSCILLFAGYVLLYLFKQTALVFAGSLFMMCGYLSGAGVFGAKVRDLTPRNKAGMLQGVRIVSQVLIPGIIGPFISKCVLSGAELVYNNDGTTSFIPNSNIFIAALGVALICVLIIYAIKKKESK